jgi:hypothetical protein
MNRPDITSGEQYGLLLSYELAKIDTGLPSGLLDIWCDEVYHMAIQSWDDYIIGKKEYYELTVEEIEASYNRASQKFTEEIIDGMVDKELLQVSVDGEGEFLYSLTDKGREYKKNWIDE